MEADNPLVLTLRLDDASFAYFDALRKKYFPPERNFLAAHLTLFHHLPPGESTLHQELENWSQTLSPLSLQVKEVKFTGRGVVYKIDCGELQDVHRQMQAAWKPWLTAQDSQKLWPHVTVQNKVQAAVAMETFRELEATFQPFEAKGLGFRLWLYEGGPWRWLKDLPFKEQAAPLSER